jgi:hypothetical protein
MKNWMLRGAGLIAMSTSLLACVGMEDDLAAETGDVVSETDAVDEGDLAAAAGDVSEKAVAPKLVPLVVELWQDFNYTGDVRYVIKQEAYFGNSVGCTPGLGFENTVSSVRVRKGPDYDAYVAQNSGRKPYVMLYQDALFNGRRLALDIGGYPDLRLLDFENKATSIALDVSTLPPADLREPTHGAATHGPISVILEAHTEPLSSRCTRNNQKMTILRSKSNIDRDFGSAFNDKISSIDLVPGTSYDVTNKVTLHFDPNFAGYRHGFYQDVTQIADFRDLGIDNEISSIAIEF